MSILRALHHRGKLYWRLSPPGVGVHVVDVRPVVEQQTRDIQTAVQQSNAQRGAALVSHVQSRQKVRFSFSDRFDTFFERIGESLIDYCFLYL